jgi:diguanylate cyclase (GGDEF)-like protein
MKLRYKINLLIIGLIVLSISIPSIIYFYFSKEILKAQVDSHLQSELTKNIYEINGWIDTQSQAVVIISNIIQNAYEKEDITRNLLQSYIANKNISDIYIGFNNGEFLSGIGWIPDQEYDPRERPWYQEVMEAGQLNISNVYYDFTSKQYAVAIGIPLTDRKGEVIGVLSEDILLDTIYDQVLNIKLENLGYAFLVDMEGSILSHQDKDLIGKNINELVNSEDRVDLTKNKSGQGNYIYKGIRKIVVYDEIEDTNWILALVVDEEQVYKPLSKLLLIYLLVAFITILFSIILSSIFIKNIISRLKSLSSASILISQGNFDTNIGFLGRDEIGDVSKALDRMKSEIKDMISELNLSKMNYEELIENAADVIYSVNKEGYLVTANTVFLNKFGIDPEVIGNDLFANLVEHSELGAILIVLGEEVIEKKQLINRKIDNIENHYYNVTLSPILDKNLNEVKGVTTILHDASDLELSRNNLEWITHHDLLTELPNRFKLMEDMDTIILKAKTNKNQLAVLFIDLDDFKNINDTLGYSTGDYVLKKVGDMLGETCMSYRIGADEFALVLDEFESLDQLEQQVSEISKMLHHSFEIELNTIYNSATIGVVVYPNHFSDINEMMIRGDAALNYAKTKNRSQVQFYDYSISTELEERVLIEKGLRKALDNNEFLLYYQPIMNQGGEKIKGFEALIRWRKVDGTIISPCQFMPIAENMALIHDLGLWVIDQALQNLKEFQEKSDTDLTMAINLSANQIKHLDFYDKVIERIMRSGVNPHRIEFEITESVLIESLELMKSQFQSLINLGVKISLDDFGTGYSSLNYLQHFPFQILKIDKSFVDYIREDTVSRSLVEYIIDIAHGMKMEIVAEGVENQLQKDYLIEKKCDYFQGYLFSKPIPSEEVYDFIIRKNNKLF